MPLIQTHVCLECGSDTRKYGYVNRIPADRTNFSGWHCGGCSTAGYKERECSKGERCPAYQGDGICLECQDADEIGDEFDEDLWNEWTAQHFPDVDGMFPQAKEFRKLMESEEDWTEEDRLQVWKCLTNYD